MAVFSASPIVAGSYSVVNWLILQLSLCLSFCQQTALHIAASKGRDYTVKCLVKQGANISIKDRTGVSVFTDY